MIRVPLQLFPHRTAQDNGDIVKDLGELLKPCRRVDRVAHGSEFDLCVTPDVAHNGPSRVEADADLHGSSFENEALGHVQDSAGRVEAEVHVIGDRFRSPENGKKAVSRVLVDVAVFLGNDERALLEVVVQEGDDVDRFHAFGA